VKSAAYYALTLVMFLADKGSANTYVRALISSIIPQCSPHDQFPPHSDIKGLQMSPYFRHWRCWIHRLVIVRAFVRTRRKSRCFDNFSEGSVDISLDSWTVLRIGFGDLRLQHDLGPRLSWRWITSFTKVPSRLVQQSMTIHSVRQT